MNTRNSPAADRAAINPREYEDTLDEKDKKRAQKPGHSEGIADKLLHPDQSQGPNEPLDPEGDKRAGGPSDADHTPEDSENTVEGRHDPSNPHRTTTAGRRERLQ